VTRVSGDAAKWKAAAAWRKAKQSSAGSIAVIDGVKWQAAAAWRYAKQSGAGCMAVDNGAWQGPAAWRLAKQVRAMWKLPR
jgi:hypothetical protein